MLEIHKNAVLRRNAGYYDRRMQVTNLVKNELRWWIDNIERIDKPIRTQAPDLTILTAARLKGSGCHIRNPRGS